MMKKETKNGVAVLIVIVGLLALAFALFRGDYSPCSCKTKEECSKLPRFCWKDNG